VERRWIGGSCPNINCLPSKNEIWSAKVADLVRHAGNFGLKTGLAQSTWQRCETGSAKWSRRWSQFTERDNVKE
jgi:pyruvate/2-oxoglutarate dehydrogenase complex dihydrolipoamide dehydrogenase (E3) component